MAITRTALAAACKASDLTLSVVSTATGFPAPGLIINPQQPVVVDEEVMWLVMVPSPGVIQVRSRGSDGTLAQPHDVSAQVMTAPTPNDFPALGPFTSTLAPVASAQSLTYGQNGAITIPPPGVDMFANLNGAVSLAMTLAAPNPALIGSTITITNWTYLGHTVLAAPVIFTGVGAIVGSNTTATPAAGGTPAAPGSSTDAFSQITFPALVGAAVKLIAQNGVWLVISVNGPVTFA